jgi:hypothetical protein
VATFGGIALVALAQWLGDGRARADERAPARGRFASATQPPRGAALVLVAVGVLAAAPLIHGSMSDERPITVAAQILLWWGLAITREAVARAAASVATRRAPDGAPLSASIGCAELRSGVTVDEVFATADADLLAAKAARRATSS